jgi:hypothetical protein
MRVLRRDEDVRGDDTDEKALIERIRQQLNEQLTSGALPARAPRPESRPDASPNSIAAEVRAMEASSDVADVPLRSYRALLGPALTAARNMARKLFAGPLERQASYNAANLRLARAYRRELDELRRRCDALEAELRHLRAKIGE